MNTPRANAREKSTPIAVSPRTPARRVTNPIDRAVITAGIAPPMRRGPWTMEGATKPGDAAWVMDDVGRDDARERRVADRIADEREALEDDERPDDRADDPDERCGDQRPDEEHMRQRLRPEGDPDAG